MLSFQQKFGYITVKVELLFVLVTTIFLWLPNVPENSSFVLNCLGDDDVIYFKYDYFTPGGYSRKKYHCQLDNFIGKYICHGSNWLIGLICSNLLEIYLTSAVMSEIKKNTKSVMQLLSRKSLADRKRYVLPILHTDSSRGSLYQRIINHPRNKGIIIPRRTSLTVCTVHN